jgi:endonuclease G, mitochondrial
MKKLLLTLGFILPLFVYGQKTLRDSIYVKNDMFELVYSEKLQQPKFIRYTVQCPNGTASRTGMDFYVCDSILTSDNKDYVNNPYDKGHLAPAADFNCNREMLYRTFTYLNCSLQEERLNRTTWRLLEVRERDLAKTQKVVVEIRCIYSSKSMVLPTGATIPDSYYKTIKYGKNTEVYYFKNERPLTTDYTKYRIK